MGRARCTCMRRRVSGAAIRSLLFPGWGQMVHGHPAVARVYILISGMVVITGLTAYLFVGPTVALTWLLRPDVLLGLVILNIVFLAGRLITGGMILVADREPRGRIVMVILLAMTITVPHLALGWVGLRARAAIVSVFPSETEPIASQNIPTTTTTVATTTTTSMSLTPIIPLPGQGNEDIATVETTPPWEPFGTDRLNILVLGGDAGPGRAGLRTDTMIVASIDPISGDAALIGVPRNYGGFALTDGEPFPGRRLNHVYRWGQSRPDRYPSPDPGAAATVDAIQAITGLEIDNYVLVDLTGFAELIDAFGGVTLHVPRQVDGPRYDPDTGGYEMVTIEPGSQHLDGAHALAYARARYGSSDYARMSRQRCILGTMIGDADFLTLLGKVGELLLVVENNVTTDIPSTRLPELIQLIPRVQSRSIRSLGLDATWASGLTADGHPIPDVERIRAAVAETVSSDSEFDQRAVTIAEACD